ncbi:unnamed protein product [Rotaria sp. Silwood2]|nr:unnamed protein product [Rotaria sp. Silwood2]CAF2981403.1 unnamed protein product [Rotaria sp. Silwood2]CAF3294884.1 unnamed protein product [Rotaria sp. Silwood2]CAF3451304.1 unnamed protein product [Rotaria sp. Silwood2]CAF4359305.1 unnamed protein product [Rotaria sp. Silwood2]
MNKSTHALTGINRWLNNLMCNVPELVIYTYPNATTEGHIYWLFKNPDDDIVTLYDLTNLCETDHDDNLYTLPVAILLYKMKHKIVSNFDYETCLKESGTICTLLKHYLDIIIYNEWTKNSTTTSTLEALENNLTATNLLLLKRTTIEEELLKCQQQVDELQQKLCLEQPKHSYQYLRGVEDEQIGSKHLHNECIRISQDYPSRANEFQQRLEQLNLIIMI